ncbi:hypothetical protein D3C74_343640 [compost metagenome]
MIRLIAAVVGCGETGSTASPSNALAKEDLPALNAPNSASVNVPPASEAARARRSRTADPMAGYGSTSAAAASSRAAAASRRRRRSAPAAAVGPGTAAATARCAGGASGVSGCAATDADVPACGPGASPGPGTAGTCGPFTSGNSPEGRGPALGSRLRSPAASAAALRWSAV